MNDTIIPPEHVASLESAIALHDERLVQLRELISMASAEAVMHEALIALGRHDGLMRLIEGYFADTSSQSIEALDVTSRAIELPDNVTLNLLASDFTPDRLVGELRCGRWWIRVGWDREDGFFAVPDTRFIRLHHAVVAFLDLDRLRDAYQDVASKADLSKKP